MKQKRLTFASLIVALVAFFTFGLTIISAKAEPVYVAEIVGGAKYETLQSAFDNATNGDTVKLLANVTTKNTSGAAANCTTIIAGKTVTFDLAGKTYAQATATASSGYAQCVLTIRSNSDVTIIDSVGGGKITSSTKCVQLQGKLTLKSGTIACEGPISNADLDPTGQGGAAYPIWMYCANVNDPKPEFVMEGGALKLGAGQQQLEYPYAVSVDRVYATVNCYEDIKITISAGEIDGFIKANMEDDETGAITAQAVVSISGGKFSNDQEESYFADGYSAKTNQDGTKEVVVLADYKDSAVLAVTNAKSELLENNRYTAEKTTELENLFTTANTAIANASNCTAVDSAVETFTTSAEAVEVIALADYKASAKTSVTNRKTSMLTINRYTDENKTAIETLFVSAMTGIDGATDYAGVDSAVSTFNMSASAVAIVPIATVREDAISALNAIKANLYRDNRYTDENKAYIETYYAMAVSLIESATTANAIDGEVANFNEQASAVEFITLDDYKADAIARLEAEKQAMLDKNTYSKEDIEKIEQYFESAKANILMATVPGSVDTAYETFSVESETVEPQDNSVLIGIVIAVAVIVILGSAIIVLMLLKRKRALAKNAVQLKNEDEPVTQEATKPTENEVKEDEPAEEEQPTVTIEEQPVAEEPVEAIEEPVSEVAPDEIAVTVAKEKVDFTALAQVKPKTFTEKLELAPDSVKEFYRSIKEELLSYAKVKSRTSQKGDSFRVGRKLLAKIVFAGKNIKCYLALDPKAYEYKVYHHRDESVKKSYATVPMVMRVRSKLATKKTVKLISDLATQHNLIKK